MSRLQRMVVYLVAAIAVSVALVKPGVDAQQAVRPVKTDDAPAPAGILIPQGQKYATTMTPNQEVPIPVPASTGRGTGWVVLNAAETQITVVMTFTGLTSNAIAGHIHGSATSRPGVNGPVIFDLAPTSGTSGSNTNTIFAVTPAQVALLRSNLCYINVHSINNPGGEIRGQLHLLELPFDADTDGKTDAAVFRPSDTIWYLQNSSTNTMTAHQWGQATDVFVPGDYDGDGRLDPAVWRPTIGTWFIRNSSTGLMTAQVWGAFNDIPVPADYDKDGRTDVAVFRPSDGNWYLLRSTAGPLLGLHWGTAGDRPLTGDFDADGRADVAVKRPGSNWWALTAAGNVLVFPLDQGATPLVPGDYTGDGATDIGQFNPATGIWQFMDGTNGSPFMHIWGGPGDIPVAGDYDSDGRTDVAVWRPSEGRWYLRLSLNQTLGIINWGASQDIPLPSMFTMPSTVPTAVNDTATVAEDSGATTIDVLYNNVDPDGGPQRVWSVTQPANGTVVITGGGSALTYQPNANYCNSPPGTTPDTFTYTLAPGGSTATVSVTVTCVDDPPVAVNDNATVAEDSGATAIPVLTNDTDIDGGPISITSVTQPTNGVVVITGGGTGLTYQPNADYCNSVSPQDTFTYTLTPGGSTATVGVLVTCVNDAPVATDDVLSNIAEDSGPRTIPFASLTSNDSPGPGETGQTLTITAVSNPVGGTVNIVATDVVFTPTLNYSGPASFDYTLQDNGAPPLTDTGAVTFTITPVNDPPVAGDDILSSVLEDSGQRSILLTLLMANDTVGPANEATDGQSLLVTQVTNAVGGTAILSGPNVLFTPAANFFGTASFDYTIQDDGTTNGAPDPRTDVGAVSFTVTAVNDAPSFTIAGNPPAVNEDSGAQTVASSATAISPGPNEAGQIVSFLVFSNSNPTLFSAGPSIASNGTLTYTPAANQNGTATIQVQAQDNGGTANGGVDTSGTQSYTITVNAVNDAPVAQPKSFSAQANMQILGVTGFLTGVTDADSGVNGCTPTFTLAGVGATSPAGGSVVITSAATGTVDFDPPPGASGPVTFTYTVSDNGCPGTATSAPATATVTVNGPVIWFVNNAVVGPGDGRLSNPFKTLASADAVDASGHGIFLYAGTYTTGLVINTNEALIGQGMTGSFDAVFGITPPAGTIARPTLGGTRPTVQGTVTVNEGTQVRGLNIAPASGVTALNDTAGAIVSLAISEVSLTTTSAVAANLSDVNGSLSFTSISANGGTSGISLTNTTGSFTMTGDGNTSVGGNSSGGTIQNTTSHGISLTNSDNLSLTNMNIQDTDGSGVNGTAVTNFTFANGAINNSGDTLAESNITFNGNGTLLGNNVNGTLTITNSVLTNAFNSGVDWSNDAGTISDAVITGNTITSTTDTATSKGCGVSLVGIGNTSTVANLTKATISNNTIMNFPSGCGIQVNYGNSNATGPGATVGTPNDATNIITITNNVARGFSPTNRFGTHAIIFSLSGGNPASRTVGNFNVSNNGTAGNPIGNGLGIALGVGNNGYATMTATINNNVIVANNTVGSGGISGGNGVVFGGGAETPDLTLTVQGNDISQTDGNGILLVGRGTSGIAKMSIKNNVVAAPLTGVRQGIRIDAGNSSSINDQVCLDISGNTSAPSVGQPAALGIGLRKQGTDPAVNVFGIEGLSPSPTGTPIVETHVNAQNPLGQGTLLISATTGFTSCASAPNLGIIGGQVTPASGLELRPAPPAEDAAGRLTKR